ncbi:AEC family transporter [Paenibacillus thalictri]|uniref:AEC family transporter n=1 Tax=Paenibacillus thalictri TaxID=2527873 RepID=A0A4Q9DHP8_9BACL|nr:AEC family transporter [Paenibacillus thalictri]TBL72433.1 AEC family transporter [Paenibacillus thalictri]
MDQYWQVMFNVITPILFTCICGVLLQKYRNIDLRTITDLSLFVLAPCMVIISLAESSHDAVNIWQVASFIATHTTLCWLAARLTGRLFRMDAGAMTSMTLTTMFGNAVNYGLPVLLLAYGAEGFSLGVNYVVMQIVLVNTLGLYIASRSNVNVKQALIQISRTPLLYAVAVGIVIFSLGIVLPKGIANSLHLVGNAYAAVVVMILGVQLYKVDWSKVRRKEVWIAVSLRLLIVPILSKLCLMLLGIHGLLASVLFVHSSMPAAINTAVLVEKYGGDKEVVTLTVAITTLISFATLPWFISMSAG